MRLPALSIGYAVPETSFDATVHSVFQSTVNLTLGNGSLIALLASDRTDLPHGIGLKTPDEFSFEQQGVVEKAVAVCRAEILRIAGTSLIIDLRGAARWQAHLDRVFVDMSRSESRRAWQTAFDALARHPETARAIAGVALLITQGALVDAVASLALGAEPSVNALMMSTQRNDVYSATRAARELVGLGPGLTPSGDDFLVGYLAGLWVTVGNDQQRAEFVRGFAGKIRELATSANDISRAYLVDVSQAEVSGLIAGLIRAIGEETRQDAIREAALAAMNVGKTSGADGVAGLLLGLIAWQNF